MSQCAGPRLPGVPQIPRTASHGPATGLTDPLAAAAAAESQPWAASRLRLPAPHGPRADLFRYYV